MIHLLLITILSTLQNQPTLIDFVATDCVSLDSPTVINKPKMVNKEQLLLSFSTANCYPTNFNGGFEQLNDTTINLTFELDNINQSELKAKNCPCYFGFEYTIEGLTLDNAQQILINGKTLTEINTTH